MVFQITMTNAQLLSLKLIRTNLNYRVLETSAAAIFLSNDHSLYEPIAMLDFNCMCSIDLPGARGKRKKTQIEKFSPIVARTHNIEVCWQMLHRLSYPGLMIAKLLK